MNFAKVDFTEAQDDIMDLNEFTIMGLTMTGHFFSDIGDRENNCTCRVPTYFGSSCGSRFGSQSGGSSRPTSKWGIRIVLNLYNNPPEKFKVDVVAIDLFRCPVSLNRIIAEDRLNAALRTNLTEHISGKMEEYAHMSRVQMMVIDGESAYAPPPKEYDQ